MLIAWRTPRGRVVSRVATLGLGGLFIEAPAPPAVGDLIEVFFEVPGGEVRARGVVRMSETGKELYGRGIHVHDAGSAGAASPAAGQAAGRTGKRIDRCTTMVRAP